MFFKQNLQVNVTLDYIQSLPEYKMYTSPYSDDSIYKYGVPEELITTILDNLGIDTTKEIDTGKHIIRSTLDFTKGKECTVFFCRRKEQLSGKKLSNLAKGILIPDNLKGEIDICSIGKPVTKELHIEDTDNEPTLEDLISSQVEDKFSEEGVLDYNIEG